MWTAQIYCKCCANCEWWNGAREVAGANYGAQAVIITDPKSSNLPGMCEKKKNETLASNSCYDWKIWGRL